MITESVHSLDALLRAKAHFESFDPQHIMYYRGQSKSSYQLVPSLYRRALVNIEQYRKFEMDAYLDFEKAAKSTGLIIPEVSWHVLAYMQHYGVKTRLLDWSRNFDVALFFAFENWQPHSKEREKSIATIWLLNPGRLVAINKNGHDPSNSLTPKDTDNFSFLKYIEKSRNDLREAGYYGTIAIEITEVEAAIPRLKVQEGAFTIHDTPVPLEMEIMYKKSYPVKEWHFNWNNEILYRINLLPEAYNEIKEYLDSRGMNYSKIYPDHEGIAKYINRVYFD